MLYKEAPVCKIDKNDFHHIEEPISVPVDDIQQIFCSMDIVLIKLTDQWVFFQFYDTTIYSLDENLEEAINGNVKAISLTRKSVERKGKYSQDPPEKFTLSGLVLREDGTLFTFTGLFDATTGLQVEYALNGITKIFRFNPFSAPEDAQFYGALSDGGVLYYLDFDGDSLKIEEAKFHCRDPLLPGQLSRKYIAWVGACKGCFQSS